MILIKIVLIIIPLLISVAFLTLLERKLMSSVQRRIGPNTVGFFGILQPFADGLKIALKDTIISRKIFFFFFFLGPIWNFSLGLACWSLLPWGSSIIFCDTQLSILLYLCLSSLQLYGTIISSWASNSKYALLGGLRAVSQTIAYELTFCLVIMTLCFFCNSFSFLDIIEKQRLYGWFIFPFFPLFFIFFITVLAETYRVPFDLPEAEGEIVAGVHVEYASLPFALFYLTEYSNLLFMSALIICLFFGGSTITLGAVILDSTVIFSLKILFFVYLFILLRASLPRYKYDKLLDLGWRILLPLSTGLFFFYLFILL